MSRRFLILLWLVIAAHIVVNNFSNMRSTFGLGMWWITLGLIAVLTVHGHIPSDEAAAAEQLHDERGHRPSALDQK